MGFEPQTTLERGAMTARILLKSSVSIARIVNNQPVMVAGGAIWEMSV